MLDNVMTVPSWNHNFHYHDLLLSKMRSPCRAALDVGCGDGTLVAKLARRTKAVVGIDKSKDMIQQASSGAGASGVKPNAGVTLIHDDFIAHAFADSRFDFITCVATIHHMDLRAALERVKSLLQPHGTVAVLGLARASSAKDFAFCAAGFVIARALRLRHGHFDPGAPIAEPRMTYGQVQRTAFAVLPGATFQRLVLFRYLLTWTAPA